MDTPDRHPSTGPDREVGTRADRLTDEARAAEFDTIMASRNIYCLYQPIVRLDTSAVVGYEALARGPVGTGWSRPDALFDHAAATGRLAELDWICRAAACRGALAANLPADLPLFVNIEPASARTYSPPDLVQILLRGSEHLQIVAEVTERSIGSDPVALLDAVEVMRGYANRIALDDIGVDNAGQAIIPLLRPDVIKLDRSIVQNPAGPGTAAVVATVRAAARRSSAVILAEGIETPQHLDTARRFGATLGQGWLFGRPAPLPEQFTPSTTVLPEHLPATPAATTPYGVVRRHHTPIRVPRETMLPLSRQLEDEGVQATEPTLLLATFQHVRHFGDAARRRYRELAGDQVLAAAFAQGMPEQPEPRVRGYHLADDDPLIGEWNVIVIGDRFAGGLFAREVSATDSDGNREFDVIVSRDRDLVVAAAHPLLQRLNRRTG